MNISFLELLKLGGPVMWLLLATSIIALAIILERVTIFVLHHQNFEMVVNKLRSLIVNENKWQEAEGWCNGKRGPFTRLASAYLRQRHQPREVLEDLLHREGLEIIGQFDEHLRWLATIAQIATLLGLLATFHVMIMRLFQSRMSGNMATTFMNALWECLLTTMAGLMIAIPCSAVYQLLEGRLDKVTRQIDILVSYLDEWQRNSKYTLPVDKQQILEDLEIES